MYVSFGKELQYKGQEDTGRGVHNLIIVTVHSYRPSTSVQMGVAVARLSGDGPRSGPP